MFNKTKFNITFTITPKVSVKTGVYNFPFPIKTAFDACTIESNITIGLHNLKRFTAICFSPIGRPLNNKFMVNGENKSKNKTQGKVIKNVNDNIFLEFLSISN